MRQLSLEIRLQGKGFPRRIAECTGGGSSGGYMDVSIESVDLESTKRALDDLMNELVPRHMAAITRRALRAALSIERSRPPASPTAGLAR